MSERFDETAFLETFSVVPSKGDNEAGDAMFCGFEYQIPLTEPSDFTW